MCAVKSKEANIDPCVTPLTLDLSPSAQTVLSPAERQNLYQ